MEKKYMFEEESIEKPVNIKQSVLLDNFLKRYVLPLIAFNDEEKNSVKTKIVANNNNIHYPEVKIGDNKIIINLDEKYQCAISKITIGNNTYSEIFKSVMTNFIDMINPYKKLIPDHYYLPYSSEKSSLRLDDIENDFYENLSKLAIQKGICKYISTKQDNALKVEKLIHILESWSMKTYEGRNVCYGIVIDQDIEDYNKAEYIPFTRDILGFLDEEFSAVISDGFSSVLLLDRECKFRGYESITSTIDRSEINSNHYLPFRFHDIIYDHTKNNRVGLFMLQNGDIIIAKNKEISFIKRNNKWLNFDRHAFINSIKDVYKYNNENKYYTEELFPSIYSTMLDVSFSHTGGIIAVVNEDNLKGKNIMSDLDMMKDEIINGANSEKYLTLYKNEFLSKYDVDDNPDKDERLIDVLKKATDKSEIDKYFNSHVDNQRKIINDDIVKRLTKRKYIVKLLDGKIKFTEIDKKLLAELIGLDGAFIMNTKGEILSFGAIIQNNAGSSGGGRGAAAKKLSECGGFAIKISTDGYIEVFDNAKKIYSIK